jgi:hypothetical protein
MLVEGAIAIQWCAVRPFRPISEWMVGHTKPARQLKKKERRCRDVQRNGPENSQPAQAAVA